MDAILTALRKIFEIKIVSYIDTGDKTLNGALTVFCLAVIECIFTGIKKIEIKKFFLPFSPKITEINENTIEKAREQMRTEITEYKITSWGLNVDHVFTGKFMSFTNDFLWFLQAYYTESSHVRLRNISL